MPFEFLNRLVRPDYENAIWDIRQFALAVTVSPADRLCAEGLRVELHQYIAERTLLRVGLCGSLIDLNYVQYPDTHVALAQNKYRPAMEEHFTRLPGVDARAGENVLSRALYSYGIAEPEVLASRFLSGLHGRDFEPSQMGELPSFTAHIGNEFRGCIELVQRKLKPLASERLP